MKKSDSSLLPVLVRTELGKKSPLTPWPSSSCDSGGIEGLAMRLLLCHRNSRVAQAEVPSSSAMPRSAAKPRAPADPVSRNSTPSTQTKICPYSRGAMGLIAPVNVNVIPRAVPAAMESQPSLVVQDAERSLKSDHNTRSAKIKPPAM